MNGSDIYISRIIRDLLTEKQKVNVSQAHRKLKDVFSKEQSIIEINQEIEQKKISDKKVEIGVDMSARTAWETNLVTCLDEIPFSYIGRGEQCLVKTKLALSHKKTEQANVLLLEEPENHLSHSKLNLLIRYLKESYEEKQIIISTHNSFVANKLGLKSLVLLNVDETNGQRKEFRINQLDDGTQRYFEKLPGYETLRLLLCKKAILVEGDSDELIVQKAYMFTNGNKLPIEDEVDVISVRSLAFKRFLNIAKEINQPVVVVTDNDGDYQGKVVDNYCDYAGVANIKICADDNDDLNTLEPQLVAAHSGKLDVLRDVLGISEEAYPTEDSIAEYMQKNKTDSALKIFETDLEIDFPNYILNAIS